MTLRYTSTSLRHRVYPLVVALVIAWAAPTLAEEHSLLLEPSAGLNVVDAIGKSEITYKKAEGDAVFMTDPGLVLNLMLAKNAPRWFAGGEMGFMHTAFKSAKLHLPEKSRIASSDLEGKLYLYRAGGVAGYYIKTGNTRVYIGGGAGCADNMLQISSNGTGHSAALNGNLQFGVISKGSDIISLGISARADYFHPISSGTYKLDSTDLEIKSFWLPVSILIHLGFGL